MNLKSIIYLYYFLGLLIAPFYCIYFLFRIIRKKEDINRILERFGIVDNKLRFAKKVIWIHAASIGESLATLTLIESIQNEILCNKDALQDIQFLITTGTKSSGEILKTKLPVNTVHQFLPIDNIIFINNFLNFWQPKISIFIESEIWPGIIYETSKKSNLLLFNARLSDKSFFWWQKFSYFFKLLLNCFKEIIVQSEEDLKKFRYFVSGKVINLGNIKFANKKLSFNLQDFNDLNKILADKKVILFASTHLSDEKVVLHTVKPIKELFPNSYFILVLRHPHRISKVESFAKKMGLTFTVRSNDKLLPNINDDIYIVDTFNELGLFYNIAHITFVGGSFLIGGHSPLEAAHFNNIIMFGPHMEKCQDIANLMLANKAALQIIDEVQLQNLLEYFLIDKNSLLAEHYKQNALNFVNSYQQVVRSYLAIIKKYI